MPMTPIPKTSIAIRVADAVTAFAASIPFLVLHAVWWLLWWAFHLDLNTLTMVLSLEAIILTALVLMSQQRAADRDRVLANKQAAEVDDIDALDQETAHLIRDMHAMLKAARVPEPPTPTP